ncbi:ATP-grasp domain-containing protein [Candidatus Woesearchaeota archaeon]|nr:ATP-grasp domain-containing protein [Candidatus Woesearchaeota archaeon]
MKKIVMGYITDSKIPISEDKKFFKIANKMNVELLPFNISSEIVQKEIEEKAKKCDIIFNDSGFILAEEIVKTLEILGKKVTEPSKIYEFPEDKWLFFIQCAKNNIPTPITILLSLDLNSVKNQLNNFNHWPVVLKRVNGERGEFVEKANNMNEAIRIIKHFWKKGNERLPIIAQEFIDSDSYRVTVIDGKIIQTALKKKVGWKATGCYAQKFRHFKVDDDLKNIVEKLVKITKINVCGIDLVKKDSKWLALEINAEPSLKMFDCEHDKLIECVIKSLKKQVY